jgi:predicted HTH transcriptional regulator
MHVDDLKYKYKKNIYTLEEILEHPVNHSIVKIVKENEPVSAGDIIRNLQTSPTSGLKHIMQLKKAGVIEKQKNTSNYTIREN